MNRRTSGFTLIELLVVIAIIAILAAILFPVFAQAKDAAKKAASISNVKQQALGAIMYAGDSDDVFCPMVEDNARANQGDGIDYDASWMLKLQPYAKSLRLFFSPNAKNQLDPALTGSRRSNGIITSYAMLPRWRYAYGADPGPSQMWRTGYGTALMDGIGGYQLDASISGPYYGGGSCSGATPAQKVVPSLSQSQIPRISETALILDAEGWDYGFLCTNLAPWPIDAAPPASAYSGVNFAGRYGYEGVQTVGAVPYKVGMGAVAFADGSVKALKTSKFFETFTTASGVKAFRYQYSGE